MAAGAPRVDLNSFLVFQTHTVFRWILSVPARFHDDDWLKRPGGAKNHPHWLLGHIAVSSDFAPGLNLGEPLVPAEWEAHFAMGSRPSDDGAGYPAVAELVSAIERAYARNLELVGGLESHLLTRPPGIPIEASLKKFLRTQERWLGLQTLHLAYHTGQLQSLAAALHPDTPMR